MPGFPPRSRGRTTPGDRQRRTVRPCTIDRPCRRRVALFALSCREGLMRWRRSHHNPFSAITHRRTERSGEGWSTKTVIRFDLTRSTGPGGVRPEMYVPTKLFFTKGVGTHREKLTSFE